ncbi:predicted protein [Botrytis cinerea T4]|uniref:Uncharacterized protein n=1 Tax=Botryotinia fuckeliana (strain T4) TaxID=999810 RepID=G2XPU1_BOTF4|nr:predicted protein [Botrytis cinerea T4]
MFTDTLPTISGIRFIALALRQMAEQKRSLLYAQVTKTSPSTTGALSSWTLYLSAHADPTRPLNITHSVGTRLLALMTGPSAPPRSKLHT